MARIWVRSAVARGRDALLRDPGVRVQNLPLVDFADFAKTPRQQVARTLKFPPFFMRSSSNGRATPDRAGVFGPETSFTLVRIHRLHIALGRKARLAEQNALANKGSVNDEERIYSAGAATRSQPAAIVWALRN